MKTSFAPLRFLAFVAGCALLASAPARAEDATDAGKRIAASILKQLDGVKTTPALTAVVVKPFGETGAAKGSGQAKKLSDAISAALSASGKLQVRDYDTVQKAQQEKATSKGAPAPSPVQALVIGDVLGGDAGAPLKADVKVIETGSGKTLAAESATLGAAALGAPIGVVAATAPHASGSPSQSQNVDVAMRRIADQLVAALQKKTGDARYERLAVLPFTETGSEAKKRELGAVVTAELSTSLRRDHGMLLVERQKLQQVMGEIKLGQSGAVDPSSAPEIGKLADAQALVMGSVAESGDRYLIDARIVTTETAETLAAASESVPAANLVAVSSDAVVLRSKKDAVFRSLLIPGWGQIYNREAGKGYVFMGAVGVSLGAAIAFQVAGSSAENTYKTTTTPEGLCAVAGVPLATCTPQDQSDAAASLRTKAENRYTARNVALIIGGSLWVLNILDAYISGVDGDKMLNNSPLSAAPIIDESGRAGFAMAWASTF